MDYLKSHVTGCDVVITNGGGETNPGLIQVVLPNLINTTDELMDERAPTWREPGDPSFGLYGTIVSNYNEAWTFFGSGDFLNCKRRCRTNRFIITQEWGEPE